jgi:hypothetical protein
MSNVLNRGSQRQLLLCACASERFSRPMVAWSASEQAFHGIWACTNMPHVAEDIFCHLTALWTRAESI